VHRVSEDDAQTEAVSDLQQVLQGALGDAFRLERELPGGGMSRVFLATESSLNRRVVIKVLPPELTSEVSAARFKQEMEFAARLQHPHILPVLAAGAREGILYYVMPFASGESLRGRMDREGKVSASATVQLVAEVADALAFAHGHGIIHRDIKPENILLEGKHAVLADFGIARALIESRTGGRLTATGLSVGTPGYMAPEQLAGESVDARADVYALAVVAYEMLAGAPPFTGPTAQAILAAHLTQSARPLSELRPDLPRGLSNAIDKALSKSPADRYGSASEFAEALQALLPAPASSGDSRKVASRAPDRRVLILAAVLAVAGAGYLGVRVVRRRAQTQALLAKLMPAADSGRLDEVARLLDAGSLDLAATPFANLAPRIGGYLAVKSEPSGAAIAVTRATPVDSFPTRRSISLGATPVKARSVVAGEYVVRFTAPGREPLVLLVNVGRKDTLSVNGRLLPQDSTARMVIVDSGASVAGGEVPAFLIGRDEVTNEEYQRFVNAGGYHAADLWPETMEADGHPVPREQALRKLVDRTGLAGPRGWSAGRFPEGKGRHPVTGVTWYEAAAYAQWSGCTLPTAAQWWRAALGDSKAPFPWGKDGATIETRANFGLAGTAEVGTHPLGMSPFGVHDLAGNVREWLADEAAGKNQHVVVGGSWQDPSYMFERSHAELFDAGFANDIIGVRLVKALPASSR
jgi:formylglycine-generating enzyme required for sulfatase activity